MVKICLPVQETWVQCLVYKIPWRRKDFPVAQTVKNLPVKRETREDPPEKGMAIHSSILAWIVPWTEKLGGLQFVGSKRVGHNCVTNSLEKKMATYFSLLAWRIPQRDRPNP